MSIISFETFAQAYNEVFVERAGRPPSKPTMNLFKETWDKGDLNVRLNMLEHMITTLCKLKRGEIH